MASARAVVERFYNEVWNQADERAAREILHRNFIFRGSLGPELRGPDGFIEYLRSVHAALAGFTCTIEELVEMGERVAAKMLFRGTHRAPFFGIEATGREIVWNGAAFFKIEDELIAALWVLGDIDAVKRQLTSDASHPRFSLA